MLGNRISTREADSTSPMESDRVATGECVGVRVTKHFFSSDRRGEEGGDG